MDISRSRLSGCSLAMFLLTILSMFSLTSIYWIINSIEVNHFKYDSYASIPEGSGTKTWLPNFFPQKARKIDIYTNLDLNAFGVHFFLDEADNKIFAGELINHASLEGELLIKKEDKLVVQVWCKTGSNSDDNLYLIGKYKNSNTYYLIGATHWRGFENNLKERLKEAEKKFCKIYQE